MLNIFLENLQHFLSFDTLNKQRTKKSYNGGDKMKKIIILLLALLVLCSCTKEPPVSDSENNSSVSQEDIDKFNSSEDTVPVEPPKEETDPVETASVAEVRGMWAGHKRDEWKKAGFSASPGNVIFQDNGVFSYTFTIKANDLVFSFPAFGTIAYKDMENFSPEKQVDHILATWGCDGVLDNGIRYFITLGKIVFVDKDFEFKGQILLPENSYSHLWPISVAFSEETGYVIPVCKIPKDHSSPSESGIIFTYDENFKLVSESGGIPVIYETFGENYLPCFSEDSYLYLFKETPYLSSALEYNLDDNSGYYHSDFETKFYDGDRAVAFIQGRKIDPEDPYKPNAEYAVLLEDKNIVDYIELDEFYPFALGTGGISIANAEIFDEGRKAEITDDFYHRTILLNFKKGTVETKYTFTEEDLSEAFDLSSDKKYSLHSASDPENNGISFSVVLKNNEKGSMKYLFRGGLGIHCGFLKNDDIYFQTKDALKIYSAETGEMTFDLGRKFPLNTSDRRENYRSVVAFRRDPEDLSFMIVYWEGSPESVYSDDESGLPVYAVAFFDESGNLLKTYESKIPVSLDMHSWPQDAVIYYRDGKYTVTTLGSKNDKGINFTFDHNKGEFSEIRKNK